MEVIHEAGHYMKVKYDWMQINPEGAVSFQDQDTGFFKDWNLL